MLARAFFIILFWQISLPSRHAKYNWHCLNNHLAISLRHRHWLCTVANILIDILKIMTYDVYFRLILKTRMSRYDTFLNQTLYIASKETVKGTYKKPDVKRKNDPDIDVQGLRFFRLPISLLMTVRLHRFVINELEIWIISYCLWLVHEAMICAASLAMF